MVGMCTVHTVHNWDSVDGMCSACVRHVFGMIGTVWCLSTACLGLSGWYVFGMFGTVWLACVRHVWDSVVGLCTACLGQSGWPVYGMFGTVWLASVGHMFGTVWLASAGHVWVSVVG